MYEWKGIKKFSFEEAARRFFEGSLPGNFKLFNDGTEAMIDTEVTFDEIHRHWLAGGEFGEEKLLYSDGTRYWERVCQIQKNQTAKGHEKYGIFLEENTDMNVKTRIEYIEEELVDALMYLEHLKEKLLD